MSRIFFNEEFPIKYGQFKSLWDSVLSLFQLYSFQGDTVGFLENSGAAVPA